MDPAQRRAMAEALAGDDPFAGMSPIDLLKLRRELAARETVSPEQRAANLRQTAEEGLGIVPVIGNALSAKDAAASGYDAYRAFGEGDWRRGALAAALAGVSGVGAVTGLPFGRAAGRAAEGAQDVAYAFPAWHGSPHDFDKFDMSKIGTGEGAQMYGHGLYFAENPEVARSYRSALGGTDIYIDGNPFYVGGKKVGSSGDDVIDNALLIHGNPGSALQSQLQLQQTLSGLNPELAASMDDSIARLRAYRGNVETRPGGRVYHAEIDAEPEDLLDWDKPLSQQTEKVKGALADAGIAHPAEHANMTGAQIYAANRKARTAIGGSKTDPALQYPYEWMDDTAASQTLRDAGIPGIRFLDQGSRGVGNGTSNYVVFDDSLIKILGKE